MKSNEFLEKLSTHLRNAIATSISVATSLHHKDVTLIHLIYGLISEQGAIASDILLKSSLEKQTVFTALSLMPHEKRQEHYTTTIPELDTLAKQALEKGILAAYERSHTYVGTEHLLFGIVSLSQSKSIFEKFNMIQSELLDQIEHYFQNIERFPAIEDVADMMNHIQDLAGDNEGRLTELPNSEKEEIATEKKKKSSKKKPSSALEAFTVDLTEKAKQGTIDPVIGREKELERMMHILCRRTKNNPVLVGEPGVGKTAIVEGLAKKIALKQVPDILKHKRIVSLDLTLMVAGTMYRGEFEARLKQIIQDIEQTPDVIVFIDELHTIIGAGSNQGTMDAANILKPALARGTLRCIGATTLDEYTKYISHDPALERRFQSITIEEPSREHALIMLQGIAPYYEQFHHVFYTPKAIEAAVDLSIKYIHDSHLPDKAIDLLDEAAAAKSVERKQTPEQKKYTTLQEQLRTIQEKKEQAISDEAFDIATTLKKKEQALIKKIDALHTKPQKESAQKDSVTHIDIAKTLGNRISVSPDILMKDTLEQLSDIETIVPEHIVGQESAIRHIVKTLQQASLRPQKKTRPLASFLFVGPSGVGKTSCAHVLAETLYHTPKALIRLDMSEFSEAHGTSKLLGSPAGYIGHNERNIFTEQIKKRPHAIILFDEIDKAHADVQKLLLQILDEGVLTDSKGKKIHFHNAIIILTTNTGADVFRNQAFGFGEKNTTTTEVSKEKQAAIQQKLKQELGTSLISRIQGICLFTPLTKQHIETLIKKHVKEINNHLKKTHAVSIAISTNALQSLIQEVHNEEQGARHVEQTIDAIINEHILPILTKKKKKKLYTLDKKASTYLFR